MGMYSGCYIQNKDIYSGCDIQCQYSDRSICNIGTQITKIQTIYIHILDITSRIHIHIWRPPGRLNGGVWGCGCPPRNHIYIYIPVFKTSGGPKWCRHHLANVHKWVQSHCGSMDPHSPRLKFQIPPPGRQSPHQNRLCAT